MTIRGRVRRGSADSHRVTSSWVFCPSATLPALVADEPGESGTHGRGLDRRSLPFVVDELGSVEPGALLRFEADIGPRLVRVAGEQQTFTDPESRVVLRKSIRSQFGLEASGSGLSPC